MVPRHSRAHWCFRNITCGLLEQGGADSVSSHTSPTCWPARCLPRCCSRERKLKLGVGGKVNEHKAFIHLLPFSFGFATQLNKMKQTLVCFPSHLGTNTHSYWLTLGHACLWPSVICIVWFHCPWKFRFLWNKHHLYKEDGLPLNCNWIRLLVFQIQKVVMQLLNWLLAESCQVLV